MKLAPVRVFSCKHPLRDLHTLAFWVAACWRFDCITAFRGLETGSSLHNVADTPAFIPIVH